MGQARLSLTTHRSQSASQPAKSLQEKGKGDSLFFEADGIYVWYLCKRPAKSSANQPSESLHCQHSTIVIPLTTQLDAENTQDSQDRRQATLLGEVSIISSDVDFRLIYPYATETILLSVQPKVLEKVGCGDSLLNSGDLRSASSHVNLFAHSLGRQIKAAIMDVQGHELYLRALCNTLLMNVTVNIRSAQQALHLETCTKRKGLSQHKMSVLKKYIHQHLHQKIALEELANLTGLSKPHFCRAFKHLVGTSPYQYVIEQRVESAKVRLIESDGSFSDIALACGFSSQSHLTHHFRHLTGITPLKYQKALAL